MYICLLLIFLFPVWWHGDAKELSKVSCWNRAHFPTICDIIILSICILKTNCPEPITVHVLHSLSLILLFPLCSYYRPEEMTASKRKEMFHRILWMKEMTTYRFVNPWLLNPLKACSNACNISMQHSATLLFMLWGAGQTSVVHVFVFTSLSMFMWPRLLAHMDGNTMSGINVGIFNF